MVDFRGNVQNNILVCKKNAENEHLLKSYPPILRSVVNRKYFLKAANSQIFIYFVAANMSFRQQCHNFKKPGIIQC
jgi:hypothetical protein